MTQPLTDKEAFLRVQDEIDAVPDAELVPINVEIPFAVAIVLGVVPRIATLVDPLARLPDYDMKPVLYLRFYAGAALHAHLRAMGAREPDRELARKIEEGARLREGLLLSAETLVHYGLLPQSRVAAIRAGSGQLDAAADLSALAELFREYWPSIASRTAVQEHELDRAAVLGFELQGLLGARRTEGDTGERAQRQRTRERAFTQLVKAYEHVRRGVRFLRAPHGDGDAYAPSLYLRRRRRGATTRTEPETPEIDARPEPPPLLQPPPAVVSIPNA